MSVSLKLTSWKVLLESRIAVFHLASYILYLDIGHVSTPTAAWRP